MAKEYRYTGVWLSPVGKNVCYDCWVKAKELYEVVTYLNGHIMIRTGFMCADCCEKRGISREHIRLKKLYAKR